MTVWLIAFLLFLIVFVFFVFSRTARFFSKLVLYGICVVIASTVGSLLVLFNGRTTDNHYVIFNVFISMCWWLGIKIKVENRELLEAEEPFILIANHQSALDVYTMVHVWPKNCVVILKSSLRYLPGFNVCAYLCCAIFINRFNKSRAHRSIGDAEKAILEHKRKIFIYPEGTRNTGSDLLPFKKGAFLIAKNADVPIVPCVFSSYRPFYNYNERKFGSGTVTVRILPKIYPEDKTVDELSAECREVMLKSLKEISDNSSSKKSD